MERKSGDKGEMERMRERERGAVKFSEMHFF